MHNNYIITIMPIKHIIILIAILINPILSCLLPANTIYDCYKVKYINDYNSDINETVYKIYKDKKNRIWIGTFDGIKLYNGKTLHEFNFDCKRPLNAVFDISEAFNGRIFIGLRNGLYEINEEENKCIHLFPDIKMINSLCYAENKLIIGSTNGLWIYDGNGKPEQIKIADNVISSNNNVNDIVSDYMNGIWFCTNEQLMYMDLNCKTVKKYKLNNNFTGYLRRLCIIKNNIYIGTLNSGLYTFNINNKHISKYVDLGTPVIFDLNTDGKDLLYIATDGNGAYVVDTRSNKIVREFHSSSSDIALPSDAVYTFWHDKENNVFWFGFSRDGLCYNYNIRNTFSVYRYKDLNTYNLSVRSFCINGKDMVIGTHNGCYYISEEKDIVHYFSPEDLSGRIITNIKYFSGHYVLASYEHGIRILNPNTLEVKLLKNNSEIENGNFGKLQIYKDSLLFACSNFGIFVFDKHFRLCEHYNSKNSELPDNYINDLLFDKGNKGWISTTGRFAIYDPSGNTIISKDLPENLFSNEANMSFNQCRNGDVLAITESNVYRAKSDMSELYPVDIYDRFNINKIQFICEKQNGDFWIGSDCGLFLVDKTWRFIGHYNENDNIPSLKFNRNEFTETPDGKFWFATNKGLVYTDQTRNDKMNAKVTADHIYIDDEKQNTSEYHGGKNNISIKWNIKSQKIVFFPLILDYSIPNGRYYEWSLNNKEYELCKEEEGIILESLPLGKNILDVKLSGHDETLSSYTITVLPSAWFYLETGLVLIMGIIVYRLVEYRKRMIRKKELMIQKRNLEITIAKESAVRKYIEEEQNRHKEEKEKRIQAMYQKSRLAYEEYVIMYQKVKECMDKEKLYTDPNLRITDLARKIGYNPTKLSQMFNQYLKQNFFDYINKLRLEEFKCYIEKNMDEQYTITAISEMCGFRKSTFFATFKKFENCTPAEYIQKDIH